MELQNLKLQLLLNPCEVVADRRVVALAMPPFSNAGDSDEAGLSQNIEMAAGGRLGHPDGLCYQRHAHTFRGRVSGPLIGEVPFRIGQKSEHLHPYFAGQRFDLGGSIYGDDLI